MPGKFQKVFQKRKSSGDVLEDVKERPVSSFRVLERPQPDNVKSFDEAPTLGLRRKTTDLRPLSEGNIDDVASGRPPPNPLNRGSGGTQKSNSSYGAYDSSSGRFSSTSTLPSSVDGQDDYGYSHHQPRPSKTMPVSPSAESGGASGFFRNAGRKFSLGGRKSMQAAETLRQEIAPPMPDGERPLYAGVHDLHLGQNLPTVPQLGRARAPTETSYASESTVTIGRSTLDKLELSAEDDDGFSDLFAGIGDDKRKSKTLDGAMATNLGRPLTENKSYTPYRPNSNVPPPLKLGPNSTSLASPNIDSARSTDGLMTASPSEETEGFMKMAHTSSRDGQDKPQSPMSPSRQNRPRRQSRVNSKGLLPRRESEFFEDTDALLVSKSVSPKNSPGIEKGPPSYRDSPNTTPRTTSAVPYGTDTTANPWADQKVPPVPPHGKAPEIRLPPGPQSPDDDGVDRTLLNDASFQALAVSADRLQTRASSPPRAKLSGKVMTPAQFERYRREQAQRRSMGDTSDSDSSKSDGEEEEEEEDEIERNRRIAKQRQRQEAQLSVYRQSMMKITGEQPMGPGNALRPSMDRNASRLSSKLSINSLRDKGVSTPEEDDEDEDVPLGILAAHGFPNKELNRPPNHVRMGSAAGIQYSSETYPPPPPPQSVSGGQTGGQTSGPSGGGNLPAFARNLPRDPFFGAGLVNQPDRQSFALGGGSPGSVYGGSNHSRENLNIPPPGGLVGVIASEERARAIRRGGHAKTFGFGSHDPNGSMALPVQMQPQIVPHPQQPPMPMPMAMPGPEQQANIQMAQQMTQMMQMQMQWMQQMMAMQAGGNQPGMNMQQMQQMQQMMQQMQGVNGQGMAGMGGMPTMPGAPGILPGGFQPPGQQGMNNGRTSTMMHAPTLGPATAMGSQGVRAMSMMGGRAPSMMMGNSFGGGPGPGYTPSIAPSERSNIGQPSRYRPVSTMPGGADSDTRSRSNSLSAQSNLGGFGVGTRASTMAGRPQTSGGGLSGRSSNMINVRVVETRASGREDDEDEAGWEEMRKRKENKRGMWRMRKSGGHGKENVSPGPSDVSTANASARSSRSSRSPKKANAPPLPPPHGGGYQQRDESGLEGVFVPDLDRL